MTDLIPEALDFRNEEKLQLYAQKTAEYFETPAQNIEAIDATSFKFDGEFGTFVVKRSEKGAFRATFIPFIEGFFSEEVRKLHVLNTKTAIELLEVFTALPVFDRDSLEKAIERAGGCGFTLVRTIANDTFSKAAICIFKNSQGQQVVIRTAISSYNKHIEETIAALNLARKENFTNYCPPYAANESAQIIPFVPGESFRDKPYIMSSTKFGFIPAHEIEHIWISKDIEILIDIVEGGVSGPRDFNKFLNK